MEILLENILTIQHVFPFFMLKITFCDYLLIAVTVNVCTVAKIIR